LINRMREPRYFTGVTREYHSDGNELAAIPDRPPPAGAGQLEISQINV
jgi:hypothetical protein